MLATASVAPERVRAKEDESFPAGLSPWEGASQWVRKACLLQNWNQFLGEGKPALIYTEFKGIVPVQWHLKRCLEFWAVHMQTDGLWGLSTRGNTWTGQAPTGDATAALKPRLEAAL